MSNTVLGHYLLVGQAVMDLLPRLWTQRFRVDREVVAVASPSARGP